MKNLNTFKTILFALLLMTCAFSGRIEAQVVVCDTCTGAWSPLIRKTYLNQTIQGKMLYCTYNVYLDIQTRICNGKVEVRLVDSYIEQLNNDPNCDLWCIHVGTLMEKISKLLVVDLGGNIILSKPAACYYMLEYELSPALELCMGAEASLYDHWYSLIPCDQNGCCVTEYVLQPNGDVWAISSVSSPCLNPPPSPVPTSIVVYCWVNGVRTAFPVNVVPPTQPLTCEPVCHTTGWIFSAKTTGIGETQSTAGLQSVIYPNPADNEISISGNVKWEKLLIMDMQGKIVETHLKTEGKISVRKLAPGSYFILLKNNNGQTEKHLLIKK